MFELMFSFYITFLNKTSDKIKISNHGSFDSNDNNTKKFEFQPPNMKKTMNISIVSDVDPHWLYADPVPQNLINADPDPGQ